MSDGSQAGTPSVHIRPSSSIDVEPGTAEADAGRSVVLGVEAKRARRSDEPGQRQEAGFREEVREVAEARAGRSHEAWSEEDLDDQAYFQLQRELGETGLLIYPRGAEYNNAVEEFFRQDFIRARAAGGTAGVVPEAAEAAAPKVIAEPDIDVAPGAGAEGVEEDAPGVADATGEFLDLEDGFEEARLLRMCAPCVRVGGGCQAT